MRARGRVDTGDGARGAHSHRAGSATAHPRRRSLPARAGGDEQEGKRGG